MVAQRPSVKALRSCCRFLCTGIDGEAHARHPDIHIFPYRLLAVAAHRGYGRRAISALATSFPSATHCGEGAPDFIVHRERCHYHCCSKNQPGFHPTLSARIAPRERADRMRSLFEECDLAVVAGSQKLQVLRVPKNAGGGGSNFARGTLF